MLKVSIITVCYNSADTVEDTLLSVLSQDHSNVEYIVIDGASKDATVDIIDRYKNRLAVYQSEPDRGIYDAMNKGIRHATGDIIGILNSDDVFADNHVLSDVVALFEKSNPSAVYADLKYVDRIDLKKTIRYWKSGGYHRGKFLLGWMPPHPTFFLKKSAYALHGLYNTELKSSADYELMLRMIHKHNLSVSYLPRVTVLMRTGGESNVSVKNRLRANAEDRRAWAMNGLKPRFFTLFLKPMSKIPQFFRR